MTAYGWSSAPESAPVESSTAKDIFSIPSKPPSSYLEGFAVLGHAVGVASSIRQTGASPNKGLPI